MLLGAAHQTAKSIARSLTIGSDVSFLKGNSPHTLRPPLGLDRMYFLNGIRHDGSSPASAELDAPAGLREAGGDLTGTSLRQSRN